MSGPHPIEIDDLKIVYRSSPWSRPVVALDGLSLAVEEGEVFGYIGANGAGKTSTIKALLGLLRPPVLHKGRALLFGRPGREPESRRRVGFLPEAPYFYEYLTGRETLEFFGRLSGLGPAERKSRTSELLERLDLSNLADRPVRTYSRGQRQRLGLAQALIHSPRLLVLDEPLGGLDPAGRREVRGLISELGGGGKTVFFSSHILADVEAICDRVGVLASGRLIASGRIDELAARRTKFVELTCSGLGEADLAALEGRVSRMRREGELAVLEIPDEKAAQGALDLVRARGGRVRSLVPVHESLEDVFIKKISKLKGHAPAAGRTEG